MPRITAKTNVFLNREKKYRMTLEFKEAIELIPCEKGSFVMADFEDEAFMLFGDEAASDQIPEDRIFAYYRNSPLWTYKRQDIIGTLVHV